MSYKPKTHIMRWAPQDWRTSRVRTRSAMTGNPMLRLVYFEALNAMWEHGGSLPNDINALADELALDPDVIGRCLPILIEMGEGSENGGLSVVDGRLVNARITRDLEEEYAFRAQQSGRGKRSADARLSSDRQAIATQKESDGSTTVDQKVNHRSTTVEPEANARSTTVEPPLNHRSASAGDRFNPPPPLPPPLPPPPPEGGGASKLAAHAAEPEAEPDLFPETKPEDGSGFFIKLKSGKEWEIPVPVLSEFDRELTAKGIDDACSSMTKYLNVNEHKRPKSARGARTFVGSWLMREIRWKKERGAK